MKFPFGPRRKQDLSDEIQSHLDMAARDRIERGESVEDAKAAAHREFGNTAVVREVTHDQWGWAWPENLLQDLRFGLRMLRKSPGFTVVTIVTLALGIGANTAIFSVVEAVMLRPLPFRNPNQLVLVWHTPPQKTFPGVQQFVVSPANFLDWRSQNDVFAQMGAIGFGTAVLTGSGQPESLQERRVSYDFFSLLGMSPVAGRGFTAADGQPGQGSVVVVNYEFSESHFGKPSNAVGKTIRLDANAYTIIGVAPPRFDFPLQARLWTPLAWTDKERAVRGNHNYIVVARLKPGISVSVAQTEMNTISSRLAQQYPVDDAGWGAVVVPLRDQLAGPIGPALLVLLGAVGFVLLIACANVANLVLTKALARGREIAIRSALGASRARIVRQVLSETALLSLAGGVFALLLARFVVASIAGFIGNQLMLNVEMGLNVWVLAFTFTLSIFTGVIAGVAPAWQMMKTNLSETLKQDSGKTTAGSHGSRVRNSLVVSEVALSLVLLVGAGLTIETLYLLRNVNPGFDPHNVLTVSLAIPQARYPVAAKQTNFFQQTLERVRVLPGVVAAGTTDSLPLQDGSTQPVQVQGQPVLPMSDQPEVSVRMISPGYLSALHIPLKQGRDFTNADNANSEPAVLVSESFANRFWPHENPIGKHLALTLLPNHGNRVVVGVVDDVKLNGLDSTFPDQAVYDALLQDSGPTFSMLTVRTSLPPASLASSVSDAVHQVDPDVPVTRVFTMDDIVGQSLVQQQLNMTLLATFAGLALLLAAVGVYGVQAYVVRHRVREIGIRMALGAQRGDVFRLIVSQGLILTAIGICIGLVAAFGLTRLMASQLYGVTATDPMTFAGVAVLLIGVALAACYIPARRATRVDPIVALRYE